MMGKLKGYLERIRELQSKLERGEKTFLSFAPVSKSLQRYMHGMMRGDHILFTAGTGVGKSMITRQMFIRLPLQYVPEIRPIIFYNSMEESYDHIISSFVQSYIFAHHDGHIISRAKLKGKTEKPFSSDEMRWIEEANDAIHNHVEPYVHIVNKNNPGDFLRYIYTELKKHGEFIKANPRGGHYTVNYPWEPDAYDSYVPDDPNLWPIIISDHIALYTANSSSKYNVIERWATESLNSLSLKLGAIVVQVQQQSMDAEKAQYTMRGRAKGKHAPSLGNLGDYRATARNATLAIGMFNPLKHNIRSQDIFNGVQYLNYDTMSLQGFYRSMHLLKHRDGSADIQIPCFFNPFLESIEELPPHNFSEDDYLAKVGINRKS